jgi:hypothetical protein
MGQFEINSRKPWTLEVAAIRRGESDVSGAVALTLSDQALGSAPLHWFKLAAGINGILPAGGGPHLFRFFFDQASLRAGKVTVFCVRQLCSSSPETLPPATHR